MITSCKYYHITELDPKFIVGSIATPPGMGSKKIREYTMFCKRDCWIERWDGFIYLLVYSLLNSAVALEESFSFVVFFSCRLWLLSHQFFSWFRFRSQFQHFHSPQSIYILAIYWATSTLVGAGFGDLTAQDIVHLVIISIMTMCGVFFFGWDHFWSDFSKILLIYNLLQRLLKIKRHLLLLKVTLEEKPRIMIV